MVIESDRATCVERDRVFPLFDDESIFLASRISIVGHARVLDLGTGCGLLALVAARQGADVIGTDINPLALACATHNAAVNGLQGVVEWRLTSLFESFAVESFDLIVANPPFLPLPPGIRLFASSDAGPLGLNVVGPLLRDVRRFLRPGGRLLLLAVSFDGPAGTAVLRLAQEAFSESLDVVRVCDLYSESLPMQAFFACFPRMAPTAEWRREIERQGFDRLRYLLLEACREGAFSEDRPAPVLQETEFSGSWRARLTRYHTWMQALAQEATDCLL
jgi:methylase of polypeptide subunit release factors